MNPSTDNLLNLVQRYQKTGSDIPEIVETPKESQIENIQNKETTFNNVDIFFEYSPIKVQYFKCNNYIYRREVDPKNNISWAILKGNISYKIEHSMQIQHLEEKIKNIS